MSNELRLLKAFIERAGYEIEETPNAKAGQYDYKVTKKPRKRTAKKPVFSAEFEVFWSYYPSRKPHDNPKGRAYTKWCHNVTNSLSPAIMEDMIAGAKRYAKYCKESQQDPKWIKQAATFLGPEGYWKNEYKLDKRLTLPRDNDRLEDFAREHGLKPCPAPLGMQFPQWRKLLEDDLKRNDE